MVNNAALKKTFNETFFYFYLIILSSAIRLLLFKLFFKDNNIIRQRNIARAFFLTLYKSQRLIKLMIEYL